MGLFEYDKADTLVSGLLEDSGHDTLVHATNALLLDNSLDSVEHVRILRVC